MNADLQSRPDPTVELRAVTVRFQAGRDATTALDCVDLAIWPGSVTAVVGRSGSGKSTLLSVLGLLRTPTAGSVRFEGTDTSSLRAAERTRIRATKIGIVFQSFHLEPSLTAAENVMLPWFTGAVPGSYTSAYAHAVQVLDMLDVGELAARRRDEMSGGQRQRVAIARALFTRPPLLLADEPTGNLDEATADQVFKVLGDLPRLFGTSVVVVTHDSNVASISDRDLVIVTGHIHSAAARAASGA